MQRVLDFLKKAEILPYEKILVVNATNGERLETYAIPGEAGSKVFRLNGAAAHKGKPGDIVTIKKESWDIAQNLRLSGVTEIYENGTQTISPVFGEPVPVTANWEDD